MTRTKDGSFEHMLRAAQKKTTSARRPYRYRAKRTAIKLSNSQKALRKKLREDSKKAYQDALKDAFARIVGIAEEMREQFGKHSVQWYVDEIMQTHRLQRKSREPTRFQAFVSLRMKEINANIPAGDPRKKATECMPQLAKEWGEMSKEERISATEESVTELKDNKDNKHLASHNSSVSAFHDVRTTMEDVKLSLQCLNARTGAESVVICVCSNSAHFNPPEAYVTNEVVNDFYIAAFKQSASEIATRLEGYCISGIKGVARTYAQETAAMRSELTKTILEKLQEVGGKTSSGKPVITRMFYKNFDTHITARYAIKLVNWPLEKFCNPSELATRAEVKVLQNAWESGTTFFTKMSREEFKEWEESRFQERISETATQGIGGTMTLTQNDAEQPATLPNNPPNAPESNAHEVLTATSNPSLEPVSQPSAAAPTANTPQQPKKRGRKRKEPLGEATFINSMAVTGLNGEVMLQKPQKKRRKDAGKKRLETEETEAGSTT
ncbi:hypothetical protein VKT23_012389 [Stygiomarasmius scandens]|uniref:HMG box domain-containing protein n=1 Tax=Marasmiellus scandens TaxID=2682957 RepID=A0ABR1JAW5_9AGAR